MSENVPKENTTNSTSTPTQHFSFLKVSHFEAVATASQDFDDHMESLFGFSESERAFQRLDRAENAKPMNPFRNSSENRQEIPSSRASRIAHGSHTDIHDGSLGSDLVSNNNGRPYMERRPQFSGPFEAGAESQSRLKPQSRHNYYDDEEDDLEYQE